MLNPKKRVESRDNKINLSYQVLQTSSRMAEIHDQFDTILILDFGSQVRHNDGSNCHIDELLQ